MYISFGYRFNLQPSLNLLSLASGIATYDTVSEILQNGEILIKWPNDILVNTRKIAGILIENSISSDELVAVIGIGINVGHIRADFPPELQDVATSLFLESGADKTVEEIRSLLGERIDSCIRKMLNNEKEELINLYRHRTRLMEGRELTFHNRGVKQKALFRGIDDEGSVILENEAGELFNSYSGELFLV